MTVTAHLDRRPRFTGPDALTLSRVPLAVAITWVAWSVDPPARPALVALFAIAIATDMLDGWWARRLGVASDRGARLDSAADAALSIAVALALFATIERPVMAWLWWAIAAVGAVRVAGLGVTFARFRVVSIAHTWGNKATGATIATAAIWTLATGRLDGWAVAVACVVAAVAALEELVIVATAHAYDRDRTGWWAVTRGHRAR